MTSPYEFTDSDNYEIHRQALTYLIQTGTTYALTILLNHGPYCNDWNTIVASRSFSPFNIVYETSNVAVPKSLQEILTRILQR